MKASGLVARLRAAGCVFAEDEAALLFAEATSSDHLEQLVSERLGGVPLEHVLGWAEFCGERYAVGAGVFVPRPRSEALVREAIRLAEPHATILDLCCGCGAVGAAVARRVSGSTLYASDIDPTATLWATRNLAEIEAQVIESDLFERLPPALAGRINLITIVAPYVPSSQLGLLPREAREFEPRRALDGGDDGLDVLTRVLASAPDWLSPGGHLLAELAEHQVVTAIGLAARSGLSPRALSDAHGATVLVATLPV